MRYLAVVILIMLVGCESVEVEKNRQYWEKELKVRVEPIYNGFEGCICTGPHRNMIYKNYYCGKITYTQNLDSFKAELDVMKDTLVKRLVKYHKGI